MTLAGIARRGGFAEDAHVVAAQVLECGIEIIDVEREVVAANVAVAWLGALAIRWLPPEDFKVGSVATAKESQLTHDAARVHVEVLTHPVVVRPLEGAEGVDTLAPDDVNEEAFGFVEVRNGETNVFGAAKPGQRHGCLPSG